MRRIVPHILIVELCREFSSQIADEEIWGVMFVLKDGKALDPNGYAAEFFKQN